MVQLEHANPARAWRNLSIPPCHLTTRRADATTCVSCTFSSKKSDFELTRRPTFPLNFSMRIASIRYLLQLRAELLGAAEKPSSWPADEVPAADGGPIDRVYLADEAARQPTGLPILTTATPALRGANPGNWEPVEWDELLEGKLGPW